MGEPALVDDGILRAIGAAVGRDLALAEVVSARRGAAVARVRDAERAFALKVASAAAAPRAAVYDPAALLRREARQWRALGAFTGHSYVASGERGERVWLLTRWLEAQRAPVVIRRIRRDATGTARQRALVATFSALLRRVQDLHDRGYVHGDLQPDHVLVDAAGAVYLLDLALAKRVRSDDFAYRGGLVHFNAPEVCAALLAGSADVPLDPLAEVYSAASMLFYLYTDHLAADYGSGDYRTLPLDDMLGRIAAGQRRSFTGVAAEPFPQLERVLDWCLQVDRARRCPSLARAVADLERAAP